MAQRYETAPDLSQLLGPTGGMNVRDTALEALAKLGISKDAPPAPPAPTYPLLPVMCNNCGNTVLLNVYTLGIADLWPAIAAARMK